MKRRNKKPPKKKYFLLLLTFFLCLYAIHIFNSTKQTNTKTGALYKTPFSSFVMNAFSSSYTDIIRKNGEDMAVLTQAESTQAIQAMEEEASRLVLESPERVTIAEGFFYQPITEDVKERIYGLSYKENCTVPYEELNYVGVLYVDFDGNTQRGEIVCNRAIARDLAEIFKELYENNYPIDKIRLVDEYHADDDLSCLDNNTSCFNYRVVGGTNSLSKHALGLAIDINPFYNPYVTYPNGVERISPPGSEPYADRSADFPHKIDKDDLCYKLFVKHGFTWGGNWKSLKDYQHFQKEIDN